MKLTETNPGEILMLEPMRELIRMSENKKTGGNMRGQLNIMNSSSSSSSSIRDDVNVKKIKTQEIEDNCTMVTNKTNKEEQSKTEIVTKSAGDDSSAFNTNLFPNFNDWWSSRNQHTDLWVLVLTLILNTIMIKESLLGKTKTTVQFCSVIHYFIFKFVF